MDGSRCSPRTSRVIVRKVEISNVHVAIFKSYDPVNKFV